MMSYITSQNLKFKLNLYVEKEKKRNLDKIVGMGPFGGRLQRCSPAIAQCFTLTTVTSNSRGSTALKPAEQSQ